MLAYSPFWILWALCILVPFRLYDVRPAFHHHWHTSESLLLFHGKEVCTWHTGGHCRCAAPDEAGVPRSRPCSSTPSGDTPALPPASGGTRQTLGPAFLGEVAGAKTITYRWCFGWLHWPLMSCLESQQNISIVSSASPHPHRCGSPFSALWAIISGRTTSSSCWAQPTRSRPGASTTCDPAQSTLPCNLDHAANSAQHSQLLPEFHKVESHPCRLRSELRPDRA